MLSPSTFGLTKKTSCGTALLFILRKATASSSQIFSLLDGCCIANLHLRIKTNQLPPPISDHSHFNTSGTLTVSGLQLHFRVEGTRSEVIQPQLQTIPGRNLVHRKFSKFIRVSFSILSPLNNLGRMEADKAEEFINTYPVELREALAAQDNFVFSWYTTNIVYNTQSEAQQLFHTRCTSVYKRKKLCNSYLEFL